MLTYAIVGTSGRGWNGVGIQDGWFPVLWLGEDTRGDWYRAVRLITLADVGLRRFEGKRYTFHNVPELYVRPMGENPPIGGAEAGPDAPLSWYDERAAIMQALLENPTHTSLCGWDLLWVSGTWQGWDKEEAQKWIRGGVALGSDAAAWKDSGFDLEEAIEWHVRGFWPREARQWRKWFSAEEACDVIMKHGYSVWDSEAAAVRLERKVRTRSRGKKK